VEPRDGEPGWRVERLIPISEVNEEFRSAGILLFIDTDNVLKIFPDTLASRPTWKKLELLVSGRHGEMKRFLIESTLRGEEKL
jgi:hypothetical protein